MSSAINAAFSYFDREDLNVGLREAIKRLPAHAQKKLAHLGKLRLEAVAKNEANASLRSRLVAERDRLAEQISGVEHSLSLGASFKHDPEGSKRFKELKADHAAAVEEIRRCDEERAEKREGHKSVPPTKRRQLAVLARMKPNLVEWILAQPAHQKWKPSVPTLSVRKGQSLNEALDANREAQLSAAAEILRVEAAPLDLDAVLRQLRNEVAALAAAGTPDVSGLFRITESIRSEIAVSKERTIPRRVHTIQGGIKWPTASIIIQGTTSREVANGSALTAWLFKDALIAKLENEIRARFKPDEALTEQERRTKISEYEARILNLMREEEALVCELEKAGHANARRSVNPLALLELEIAPV